MKNHVIFRVHYVIFISCCYQVNLRGAQYCNVGVGAVFLVITDTCWSNSGQCKSSECQSSAQSIDWTRTSTLSLGGHGQQSCQSISRDWLFTDHSSQVSNIQSRQGKVLQTEILLPFASLAFARYSV